LRDKFLLFCKSAINFEADSYEAYYDKIGNEKFKKIRRSNPKNIQYPLELDKNETFYCFTMNNLRDFNEYSRSNYQLKELNNLLMDTLENKEDMLYVNKRFNGIKTRYIQINRYLF